MAIRVHFFCIITFIYSLAMESGMTPCSTVVDEPQYFSIDGNTWSPRSNDPESAIGKEVTLKWGLSHSSNNVCAYLVKTATPEAELRHLSGYGLPFADATPSRERWLPKLGKAMIFPTPGSSAPFLISPWASGPAGNHAISILPTLLLAPQPVRLCPFGQSF